MFTARYAQGLNIFRNIRRVMARQLVVHCEVSANISASSVSIVSLAYNTPSAATVRSANV